MFLNVDDLNKDVLVTHRSLPELSTIVCPRVLHLNLSFMSFVSYIFTSHLIQERSRLQSFLPALLFKSYLTLSIKTLFGVPFTLLIHIPWFKWNAIIFMAECSNREIMLLFPVDIYFLFLDILIKINFFSKIQIKKL